MSRDSDPSAERSLSLIADCLDALVDKVERVADELAELRKLALAEKPPSEST
jgi:hypothetical protein